MAVRNVKRQDFDYYLTNLDWDDGSEVERDVKQFTRNDVFEHTYERPGFYSIKGLVFKYNELLIDAFPPADTNMTIGYEQEGQIYPDNHPNANTAQLLVRTKDSINELTSSLSEIKRLIPPNLDEDGLVAQDNRKYFINYINVCFNIICK